MPRRTLIVAVALLAFAGRIAAQGPGALVESGVRAYQGLEFDQAAGYLQRALSAPGLTPAERTTALAYLGATEIFRGRADSARGVFGRLVRHAPRYRIDRLLFPPEVTSVFDAVRRLVCVAEVRVADSATFRAGQAGLAVDLFGSSYHDLRVELQRADGSLVRALYAGPVGDSLRTEWDGLTSAGNPAFTGRYLLVVTSMDPAGAAERIVRVPLTIEALIPDTAPHPLPPADADLLPERTAAGPGLEALIGGLVLGTAIALLPSVVAPDASLSAARFGVGAAVGVAGFAGFLANRPGRPIPANVAANDRVRAEWEAQRQVVARQNETLLRQAELTVRAGSPQVIEREQP